MVPTVTPNMDLQKVRFIDKKFKIIKNFVVLNKKKREGINSLENNIGGYGTNCHTQYGFTEGKIYR